MQPQHVDDVGPVVTALVTVSHQARGDRVALGLVADQDPAERVACLEVELFEDSREFGVLGFDPRRARTPNPIPRLAAPTDIALVLAPKADPLRHRFSRFQVVAFRVTDRPPFCSKTRLAAYGGNRYS
jgi:hypothetical protein